MSSAQRKWKRQRRIAIPSLTGKNSPQAQRHRLRAQLAALDLEWEYTRRILRVALRAGLSEADFAADFAKLARRRQALESRLAALEGAGLAKNHAPPAV